MSNGWEAVAAKHMAARSRLIGVATVREWARELPQGAAILEVQRALIRKVAGVLNPGGRFLFTSPKQVCAWEDHMTRRPSLSLGAAAYEAALLDAGFVLIAEHEDEGDNHSYDACKSVLT